MYKKVKIKCLVCNSLSKYNYNISVYDDNDKLICQGNDAELFFFAKYYTSYRVIIYACNYIYPKTICKTIVITPTNCDIIAFNFNKLDNKYNITPITLNITDKYYKGLKIMKGEINLWPNHTQ